MAAITITLKLASGTRHLTANSERSAAGFAEAVLFATPREALPAPLVVSCADSGVRTRLTVYLLELQVECMSKLPADEVIPRDMG